jgi:hypothetical protein
MKVDIPDDVAPIVLHLLRNPAALAIARDAVGRKGGAAACKPDEIAAACKALVPNPLTARVRPDELPPGMFSKLRSSNRSPLRYGRQYRPGDRASSPEHASPAQSLAARHLSEARNIGFLEALMLTTTV